MLWRPRLCSARRYAAQLGGVAAPRGSPDVGSRRGGVPEDIWRRTGAGLHRRKGHPLHTTKTMIEAYHRTLWADRSHLADDLSPVTSTRACFDELLVAPDHVSRRPTDTYYVDDGHVLRPHMTAHDVEMLRLGHRSFVLTGDVYRRDAIDRSHYPVFHQCDAVRVQRGVSQRAALHELRRTLEGLARHLFGERTRTRWVDAYFPFTEPSLELEVEWRGEWLELLGCGLLRRGVLDAAGLPREDVGWAYGLGLERLAMVLFDIPDIRLFWSEDRRFLQQFEDGKVRKFKAFSRHPVCYKDISFWLPEGYHEHDFFELVRAVGGDVVERVELIDRFERAESGRSHCYRVSYRSMDRNLTNAEVDRMQEQVRRTAESQLHVRLR